MKTINPNPNPNPRLAALTDAQVVRSGDRAVCSRHELAIAILDCLIEIERRDLYLKEGYSSLFAFCTLRWNYSPPKAGRTIAAARCLKAFPAVRSLLVEQKITLCGLSRIASILTEENCDALLAQVAGKRYVEIDRIAASRRTAPPVREMVRPIGVKKPPKCEQSADREGLFQQGEKMTGTGAMQSCDSRIDSDSRGEPEGGSRDSQIDSMDPSREERHHSATR